MPSHLLRLLVVEDDPVYAQAMKGVLQHAWGEGLELRWVDDLEAALDELRRQPAEAIVLDLFLPDSGGFDTLRRVREAAPGSAIVVLTGSDDAEAGTQALRDGAQDYLVKGDFGLVALARSLRYSLERKRVEDEVRVARVARPLVRELVAALARESGAGADALQAAGRATGATLDVPDAAALARALTDLGLVSELQAKAARPRYEFAARETLERRGDARAGATTCHLTLGVLAGAVSRLEGGRRVVATETSCRSRGDAACVFVMEARGA